MKKIDITYNNKTNLLECDDIKLPKTEQCQLQDTPEAQLYRGLFDFDKIPKVTFDGQVLPVAMPADIWITDTTFRDGQQSMAPFTLEQIVELFKLMSRLGGPKGLIRQSEFFPYSDIDKKAIAKCRDLGLKFPEITTWIRANDKDFALIKDLQVAETGILVSCSDYHIFNKLGLTRAQALDKYLGIIKTCLSHGIKPRCHLEDITRADFFGFVIPFAIELQKLSKESGTPVKIRACDTMGYGVNHPGAALPRAVDKLIYGLRTYAGVPSDMLEWHGHNDFYRVVSNATAAWLAGCSSVNCSLLGIGERTGNCPTEAMAIEYTQLRGTTDGMDLSVITEIAAYFEKEIGLDIAPRTPFVGSSFNTTRAGIHADGLLKDEEIYNIFDTHKILGVKPIVSVNNTSGHAGIAYWINSYYNLEGNRAIKKNDPLVDTVYKMVSKEYEKERTSIMTDKELDAYIKKADKKRHSGWKG